MEVIIKLHLLKELTFIQIKELLKLYLVGQLFIQEKVEQKKNLLKLIIFFWTAAVRTKKEVEALGIHVGCVITYEDEFMILNKTNYVGRAIDNRMGGFMIAEVARLLHENKIKLPFGLYITNAVQEEIGLRGAQMIAERIKPDVAIVTDVCHDTNTPMIKKIVEGDLSSEKVQY